MTDKSTDPMIQLGKINLPRPKKRRPTIKERYALYDGTVEIPPSNDAKLNAIIDENNTMRGKLAAAEAKLAALPVTRDGARVIPCIDHVYGFDRGKVVAMDIVESSGGGVIVTFNGDDYCKVSECYSTADAARAALAGRGKPDAESKGIEGKEKSHAG